MLNFRGHNNSKMGIFRGHNNSERVFLGDIKNTK